MPHIRVKLINKTIVIDYGDCNSIYELKKKIISKLNMDNKYKTRIIIGGKEITNNTNISDLKFPKLGCIHFIVTNNLNDNGNSYDFFSEGRNIYSIEI